MADPLDSITDRVRRDQLARIRELDGTVQTSVQLRSGIPGFKGQKGIYKPSGSSHALWIRQTLRRAYPDKDLVVGPDGSWTYEYSPEGRQGRPDMSLDTNRALLRCMADGVPIGVFREVRSGRPGKAYEVQGLGYVESFDGAHFRIVGEPIDVSDRPVDAPAQMRFEPFDRSFPSLAPVLRRNRDLRFKLAIRRVYHERCSLCNLGYHFGDTPLALEAAHLIPVENLGTSKDIRNGMLLCSNHHSLFDNYTWTLDEDLRVRVTEDRDFRRTAAPNHVMKIEGQRLPNLPDNPFEHPDSFAIKFRMDLFEKNQ
jgi:HNH endonuclease